MCVYLHVHVFYLGSTLQVALVGLFAEIICRYGCDYVLVIIQKMQYSCCKYTEISHLICIVFGLL